MARTTLTPTILQAPNSANLTAANLTALAAAGTAPGVGAGNGVQFVNYPSQTFLLVSVGATATTPTVAVGATLYGQASAGIVMNALTVTTVTLLGPFYSSIEFLVPGTSGVIGVDFSSATSILCACIQFTGVF
jgi:hypothetical protein